MSKQVLIVDDEKNILTSLKFLMQQAGYTVQTAMDGRVALALIKRNPPDLLLLDIMLPQLDGFEVCRQIRATPTHSAMKIVMLTAKGRETDAEKGLALGANAYIHKPFSTRELVQMVNRLLIDLVG
ncbi:MAG: response regulator [Candidatus Promineifilaceae bacterium]